MSSSSPAVGVLLPVELWDTILLHVNCVRDLKAVSLSCPLFHSLVRDKICRLTRTCVTGGRICDIAHLPITNLKIESDSGSDTQISHLSGMTSLQLLDMHNNNDITDAGIYHLARLDNLTHLNIARCSKVTDVGLSHLTQLRLLRKLDVRWCELDDAAMSFIGKITSLQVLAMRNNNDVTDAGICHLAGLTNLTILGFRWCSQVTDVGLSHLTELQKLTRLYIEGCSRVTDTGMSYVAELQSLRFLDIRSCNQITPAGRALLSDRVKIVGLLH